MFDWFRELDKVRGSNGFGPNRLDFVQIESWSRLRGRVLCQWELDALLKMDQARLDEHAVVTETTVYEGKDQEFVSDRPLTPELFDALYPF